MTTDPTDEELRAIVKNAEITYRDTEWNAWRFSREINARNRALFDAGVAAGRESVKGIVISEAEATEQLRSEFAAGRESVAPRITREELARLLGKYGAEWWEEVDLQHMVSNLIEDTLDRDSIAHEMWTMGAWLDHPKCRNNPKRRNDADYSNGCEPCQKYLLVVADAVLSALGMTEEGQ